MNMRNWLTSIASFFQTQRHQGHRVNMLRVLGVSVFTMMLTSATAHEIRPAYLEINQTSDSTYNVFWKVPAVNNQIPKITPQLPFELTETNNQKSS